MLSYNVAKTKALISCTVTARLICTFVFAYAKSRFSHEAAQIICIESAHQKTSLLHCIHEYGPMNPMQSRFSHDTAYINFLFFCQITMSQCHVFVCGD